MNIPEMMGLTERQFRSQKRKQIKLIYKMFSNYGPEGDLMTGSAHLPDEVYRLLCIAHDSIKQARELCRRSKYWRKV